jgi:tetratricopeptide (TPR) repeat protein
MRCTLALGKMEEAGTLFLLLTRSDPTTPAYAHMPLAWTRARQVSEKKAREWLAQQESQPAMLLGASHLLATDAAAEAEAVLETLAQMGARRLDAQQFAPRPPKNRLANRPEQRQSEEGNPREPSFELALLATVQRWRAGADQVTKDECDRWTRQVEHFPEPLRAGPYFVLGNLYRQLRQNDRATLFYLRLPILYGEHRRLAALALAAAARLEEQGGRRSEAIRLLEEVVDRYPETAERAQAERLLAEWN